MAQCSHRCERSHSTTEYNSVHRRDVPKPLVPTKACMIHRLTTPGMRGVFSRIVDKLVDSDARWYAEVSRMTETAMLPEDTDSVSVMDEDRGDSVLTRWRYTIAPFADQLKTNTDR